MTLGLLDRQVNAIIDFNLGYADAETYKYEPMPSLLDRWKISRKTRMVSTITTVRDIDYTRMSRQGYTTNPLSCQG